jgi:hypothetical protein
MLWAFLLKHGEHKHGGCDEWGQHGRMLNPIRNAHIERTACSRSVGKNGPVPA